MEKEIVEVLGMTIEELKTIVLVIAGVYYLLIASTARTVSTPWAIAFKFIPSLMGFAVLYVALAL